MSSQLHSHRVGLGRSGETSDDSVVGGKDDTLENPRRTAPVRGLEAGGSQMVGMEQVF